MAGERVGGLSELLLLLLLHWLLGTAVQGEGLMAAWVLRSAFLLLSWPRILAMEKETLEELEGSTVAAGLEEAVGLVLTLSGLLSCFFSL